MARPRRALMLATTLAVLAGGRAVGQSLPPTPASLPGPAAVLLPPVAVEDDLPRDIRPVRSDSALPVANPLRDPQPVQRTREPVARIRFDDGDSTPIRAVDYEQSQHTSFAEPDSSPRSRDPYEYLTARPRGERASRKDDEFLPKLRGEDDRGFGEKFGDRINDLLGRGPNGGGRRFESDRTFANFISPVSNPFYAEDPRSLTELRGLGLFQKIPNDQAAFRGGDAQFFGGQARLAFGERVSVVANKVGFSRFSPGSGSTIRGGDGLAELWVGPKVVIYRNAEFQSILSAGATFQIPLGAGGAFQDTGKLSVVPYVTAAQKLASFEWGTFNGMASGGYSFGTTRDRSDFFFASAHVDFDILNKHQFYPLAELNWFGYTTDGRASALGVEGRDLANIGAASKGSNLVTWALGGRWRSKNTFWEVGAAYEGPLVGPRGLFRHRFTIDLIWRY